MFGRKKQASEPPSVQHISYDKAISLGGSIGELDALVDLAETHYPMDWKIIRSSLSDLQLYLDWYKKQISHNAL